ncbi:MAG: hypothetical protein DRJ97_07825 [Thermoprotei archaeon]|nr:MAG: hypothetical protein DRJ97_07825 [Thermoprotei archaeon]
MVASDVYVKDVSLTPEWCHPGQLVNVTGRVYFKGYDVPAEGLTLTLKGGGVSLEAKTDERGYFTFTFNAPLSVGKYAYRLSLAEVKWESLLYIVVDRVTVSWYVDKSEVRAGDVINFVVLMHYEYDGKPVEKYEYTVYRDGGLLGVFTQPKFSDVCSEPGLHVYRIVKVVDLDRGLGSFTDPGDITVRCSPPAYLSTDLLVSIVNDWFSSTVEVEVRALSGGGQDVVVTLHVDDEVYAKKTLFIDMAPSRLITSFHLDPLTLGYKRIKVTVEPVNGVKAIYETRALVAPLSIYAVAAVAALSLTLLKLRRRHRAKAAYRPSISYSGGASSNEEFY